MKENGFDDFGGEEITEFTPTEFSYGDDGKTASSSAAPEEMPVESLFTGSDDTKAASSFGTETSASDTIPEEFMESAFKAKESEDNTDKPSDKKEVIKEIMSWVRTIAVGVLVGVLLVVFVIQRDNVYGDSMWPTLNNGDAVFTQKIATYFHNYKRGDIVILDGHDMEGYDREEYLIKRIIGLPGETVRIADGHVYIKPVDSEEFFMLEEPYLTEEVETLMMNVGIEHGYDEITLGENEYYCLGDNRSVSKDSRVLGPFTEDRIKGIAIICVYPFDHFGLLG